MIQAQHIYTFLTEAKSPSKIDTYTHYREWFLNYARTHKSACQVTSGYFYKVRKTFWNEDKKTVSDCAVEDDSYLINENAYLRWQLAGHEFGWFTRWQQERKIENNEQKTP